MTAPMAQFTGRGEGLSRPCYVAHILPQTTMEDYEWGKTETTDKRMLSR